MNIGTQIVENRLAVEYANCRIPGKRNYSSAVSAEN
jgi:hypothetical protein